MTRVDRVIIGTAPLLVIASVYFLAGDDSSELLWMFILMCLRIHRRTLTFRPSELLSISLGLLITNESRIYITLTGRD